MIYTLAQIIEQTAERFPEKEAFRCLNDALTYEELNEKANQLSSYLIGAGLKKGRVVGIIMNRCLDTAIAVHGIFKAGGVFVPINPFMPLNNILHILKDCDIEYIITTPSQSNKIRAIAEITPFLKSIVGITETLTVKTIAWDTIFSLDLQGYVPPIILEEDLAFILYTSGSTGTPKGIMHTHYSGLSLAKLAVDLHSFNSEDRIGNFAPLHFDPSTFGYFAAPMVGATTVIIPDAHLRLPVSLCALVAKEKITVWYSVPLTLVQVLLHGDIDKHDFNSLRWVLFIGEVFPLKHLRALMQKWPHAKFNNLYGPAETVACTYYILNNPPLADEPIPIGTVWGNTEYKILDASDREVEKGEPGELVVRTATLMHGYWKNQKLTEKSLFRVNVTPGYDHIFYRTGDLVQENHNNELMFLGRNDRQIKFRGYRLELDGIELTILQHEDVEEVAVFLMDMDEEDKVLGAAVKPVAGSVLEREELLGFCKEHLPAYAIPETITIMEDFPRTGSGKIDRNEIGVMLSRSGRPE
ncbi:MAG TPA: amino acid adenylation domain-containing protein [Eudoraea sp.]|nr:amino acid adenylation domain-containing protein [Eudoraea sp.]